MEEYRQHTIEFFFDKFGLKDPDQKAKILLEVTDIIYDYNMHVVALEKEQDEYKRNQVLAGLKELEDKIKEVFEDVVGS